MTESAVYLQPAFILRSQDYRETSLLLDVLTRDFGRISLIAKGVRTQKSKTVGLLKPFMSLTLSYQGKTELKSLTSVEFASPAINLIGISLYCGFYINELLCCFLQQSDPHQELFADYKTCLIKLADNSDLEVILRLFELDLLDNVGYGLQLELENDNIGSSKQHCRYTFDNDYGLVESENGIISETTRLAIKNRDFTNPLVLAESKKLMRIVIDTHLQGHKLKSRMVINKIIKAKHG